MKGKYAVLKFVCLFKAWILLSVSCNNKNNKSLSNLSGNTANKYLLLKSYFLEKYGIFLDTADIHSVLYVCDKGCSGCNISFCELMSYLKNDSTTFLIISSDGVCCDMRKFTDKEYFNVFIDPELQYSDDVCFDKSKAFFIKDNAIDTEIVLTGPALYDQLNYIKDRISHP